MKIDLATLRPSTLEIPEQVASLLERLKRAEGLDSFVEEMKALKEWPTLHGKSELVRWAPVLNRLDEVFELGTKQTDHKLAVDTDTSIKAMVEVALKFSAQIFENTTSRSSYSSVDRLLALMDSSDPRIIIEVLLVFQVMGKRSRYLSNRLPPELQRKLIGKLTGLTECWGGRVREVKLDECIKPSLVLNQPLFPFSFTNASGQSVQIQKPEDSAPLLRVVEDTLKSIDCDDADRASLLSRIRLLRHFDNQTHRVDWLIARLLAMSTILYSRCGSDEMQSTVQLPPPGFIEQTCSLLHVEDSVHERMDMIKSEALRTLTAICSTETKPHRIDSSNAIRRRLLTIMDQLGATSYHGFLATYVRDCVEDLKAGNIGKAGHPSIGLCTALFSLLYHMASLDHPRRTGQPTQDTLISSGITQTMLSVISYHDLPIEYTSFVTRCVRVIDVVSALDVQGFISNKGMETCVNRLIYEVEECKKEHAFMIDVEDDDENKPIPGHIRTPKQTSFCHHQRGALIKSLLNFIKRIINERDFVEQVRQVMEYGLPDALRHIFSNVDYYSSALFHYSMQLVQNFIYQEPGQLTMLQNNHVPYTLLMALLRKDIEPTRDVIATMAQVFSALCLNDRGMNQFKKFKPFDEMLRVVLTAKYINTIKRRRGDMMDDCSYNVGSTLDDLLRQHSALKEQCLDSFMMMLNRLVSLGTDPEPEGVKIVMSVQKQPRGGTHYQRNLDAEFMMRGGDLPRGDSEGVMSPRDEMEGSDEEIDPATTDTSDNMEASTSSPSTAESTTISAEEKKKRDIFEMTTIDSSGQRVLPLGDYLCILTRIIEVILGSSPMSDMVDGLVAKNGVALLLQSMNLPHLRMELASSNYSSLVASITRHAVGGQPNMTQRQAVPNALPVRDEVVQQMVAWATGALAPIAKLALPEETKKEGLSLIAKICTGDLEAAYATLSSMTSNVLNVTTMFLGVTKCAAISTSNRENDLRAKVVSMWTEEGAELHSMLHRIANVFTWDHGLMTASRTYGKQKKTEPAAPRSHCSSASEAGDANDADSMRAMADPGSDASIESADMDASTSTAVEEGVSKAERDFRAGVASLVGMTKADENFHIGLQKKGDLLKQFHKANRSVHDLLSVFSRVCIGNPSRGPRRGGAYDALPPYTPTKNAQRLASVMFGEYYKDLEFFPMGEKSTNPIYPFYLSDILANMAGLLMDDKKHQFHNLVAKFFTSGCYKSVFSIMTDYLVPALLVKKMSVGHDLVFTEWCKLVTAMSNRQGLLQSRYKMVDAQAKLFPTSKYYIVLQMDLFNALYSLVPVLKGNSSLASKPVLIEMLFKLLSDVTNNLAELRDEEVEQQNNAAPAERVLSDNEASAVQRMVDMGFDRAACMQAIAETNNVNEAMEMLLAERDLAGGGAAAMMNRFGVLMEDADQDPWVDVMMGGLHPGLAGEEPEALIAQAVLRRRGIAAAADAPPDGAAAAVQAAVPGLAAADVAAIVAAAGVAPPAAAAADEATPGTPAEDLNAREGNLEWESIVNRTTSEWIPLMLKLATNKKKLPADNKNIHHLADLTSSIWRFASDQWKRDHLLKGILQEEIVSRIAKLKLNSNDQLSFEIGTYLHYACLIFQSMAAEYTKVLSEGPSIVTTLLDLIEYVASNMPLNEFTVSTVISPTLLWLELYDKYAHYIRRLEQYTKCEETLVFSYFLLEDRYNATRSKWQQYTPEICKKLTKAMLAGTQSLQVKNGRRDCVIDLVDMYQSTEGSTDKMNVSVMVAEKDIEKIDIEEFLAVEKSSVFTEVETAKMVNVLVELLSKCHIASYGAHGALELLVRITRDEAVAQHFVNNGGLESMMRVRGQPVRYTEALFTQLVRQCIEDDALMTKLYEQFVKHLCYKGIKPTFTPRWQPPTYTKDAFHVLSHLAHTATRSPQHYYKALLKCVRLDKNGQLIDGSKEQTKDEGTTEKGEGKSKSEQSTQTAATPVVAVTAAPPSTPTTKTVTFADEPEKEKKESGYTGPGYTIVEMLLQEALSGDWNTRDDEHENEQTKKTGLVFRLFSKSTLIYTLAELVRCYPFVAVPLTELKDKETGNSVMSVLMDRYSDPTIEKDTSNAMHVLLVTFAMIANHKANENLLNDMKSCLIGFATTPEKHTNVHIKIAEMACILVSMMHSCPLQPEKKKENAAQQQAANAAAQHGPCTNNIVKLAVKKKILNEFVRCGTRLALSKRESMDTMNHVIRVIDELAKASNLPNPLGTTIPSMTTRDGRIVHTMNELFQMQNISLDGPGVPQATLRRVDLAPNGDMTEAVVQIDVNGLDARGLESMMERVNAAVEIATREVDRRQREGDTSGVARIHVHMGAPVAVVADGERMVDPEEGVQAGEADVGELDEMRSASSEGDEQPELMDEDHEEGGRGGVMMEEDGDEEDDEDDDDDDDDGPEEDQYEDGYEDEHPDGDVLEEGDDDDEDEDDDDGDEEEEDEEEAAREDERERAQHALASASAGGEEGEGERTAEGEDESENEDAEDDDEDPFGAFEHISYLERDAAAGRPDPVQQSLQRMFMDMDSMRTMDHPFGRDFGWGRELQELLTLGGGPAGGVAGVIGGGPGGFGFDPFGGVGRRHEMVARWDQSPERTSRATVAANPLLQRPAAAAELTEQERLMQSFARQRTSGNLRMDLGRRETGLENHRQRLHLIRQNAVRRGRENAARTDVDIRRLLDNAARAADIGPPPGMHHSWRAFEPLYDDMFPGGFGGPSEEQQSRMNTRMLQESTPGTLERFRESGRMLDDCHGHILATILNSVVYYKYKKEEADARQKQAEAEKAKKEEAEREKREKEEKEKEAKAAADAAAEAEVTAETTALRVQDDGEAAMEVAEVPATAATGEEGGAMETDEPVEQQAVAQPAATEAPAASAAEQPEPDSMDTSSPSDAVVVAIQPDSPSGEHSNGSSTGATMGDETSMSGDVQPPTLEPMQPLEQQQAAAAPQPPAEPEQEMQVVPEEYRGILGVDTLPAGVDAAFLAALPEDMRAEVLRDHERQQRQAANAARAAAAVAAAPAAAPAAGADGAAAPVTGAAASAPGIEPLDPEFLSALPPELQIEIIEQHERQVRAAQAQAAAAAAPPAAPPAEDPAEVIRSLPPSLRAQVLADADDTVLNVLPQELADEARRLRNERGAHAARLAALAGEREFQRHAGRMVVRAGPGGTARVAGRAAAMAANMQSGIGQLAGSTHTASVKGVQMLDRDALSSLVIMFFADSKLNQARLQRTLRDLCTHKGTCDYLIYSLLAILKQISVNKHSEEEAIASADGSKSWTDTITVSGVGHNERVVKITNDGQVSIHPLHAPTVAKNVTDLLVQIARAYPGHFVPHVLRKDSSKPESLVPMPPFENFWQTVYAYTTSKPGVCAKEGLLEHKVDLLEESPLAHLMELLQSETFKTTPGLPDKLLKLIYTIVQTLPDDTLARLKRDGGSVADETPLCGQLKLVCGLLTSGTCSPDALNDGRLLLVEAMRAMNFRTTASIYEMLITRIENLGKELEPQVASMLSELSTVPEGSGPTTSTKSKYDSDLSREQRRRTEMERENMFYALHTIRNDQRPTGIVSSCPELQVASARALQEKGGVQSALLSSLQTICKVRDTLGLLMSDRKKRRTDEAQKKLDKAKKEWDEKKKKAEREAAAAASAASAAVAATMEGLAEGGTSDAAAAAASTDAAAPAPMETSPPAADSLAAPSTLSFDATPATSAAPTPAAPPSTPANIEDTEQPPKLEDFLEEEKGEPIPDLKLSAQLKYLEGLWTVLSDCLQRLGKAVDPHAVLVLQPAAEAFFLVHAVTAEKAREAAASREAAAAAAAPPAAGAAPAPIAHSMSVDANDEDTSKLLHFAEKHRSVLNQVLRQNQASLTDGPFAVLAACPKLLDFDVKRTHFRKQLGKMDDRQRYRRDDVPLRVRRAHIFSDSFRELFRLRGSDWKSRFYIMFEGEEGQDAGGLLREWFSVITREIFNPNYALFIAAPGDRSTYMINKASYINPEHLDYFKFVGRIIAKAIHDNKLLDCYFTRAFYKHILNLPVKYQDLESEDPEFYKSLEFLLKNPVEEMGIDLTFTLEVEEFGVVSTRPLKEGGAEIAVNDENKEEYVRLVCQMKMTSAIRRQLDAFLDGFYEVIPKQLIAMFNEQELELLISGLPDVDIDDLAANTEYRSYNKNSREIQWFWRALRSFEQEDRAKFLQFVTGTSKVPLNGFGSLEGMNGAQKFSIHQDSRGGNRLPAAHTCFNQLDLPVYDSYEKLREALLLAIRECTEGFGFA